MSLSKILLLLGVVLFGAIFVLAIFKDKKGPVEPVKIVQAPLEVELDQEIRAVKPIKEAPKPVPVAAEPVAVKVVEEDLPETNRIEELFNKGEPKLPFVETIPYRSRVSWQKGRPAWLSDYASHYETSRHFIARSLNGKPDYFKQELMEGDRFNVFKKEAHVRFHLVVDTSRCKMWLYALSGEAPQEKTLLKSYPVCLGRLDAAKTSGFLTPLGRYSLGNRIAIYKPKMMGYHNGKKVEMIRVFGTRWIPFEKEVADVTAPAKGFGLHGVPFAENSRGELTQDKSSIGKYESDGCIRMAKDDIEEVFAIIITKPAEIEIVKNFSQASLFKEKK